MAHGGISRRNFLASGMDLLGAAALAYPLRAWFPAPRAVQGLGMALRQRDDAPTPSPSAERMIVYSEEYVTKETPVSLLNSWITPVERFFVRNNLLMPRFNLNDWRLKVTGEVAHPLELNFAQFAKLDTRQVTNTLECAGNGRAFFRPSVGGVPWTRGGVGNATFSGPPLAALLRQAGLKSSARHVAFRGVDVPPGGAEQFIRSIPIDKAMDADTVLAQEMNGAPLTAEHGYPVRALVPGWIGSASIKWLTEIRVLTHEFQGYYMNAAYRLPKTRATPSASEGGGQMAAITSLPLKSIIVQPVEGLRIALGGPLPVRIAGAAWAGEASVARVEVSSDGGRQWNRGALGPHRARYAWRLWNFDWKPTAVGKYVVMSRAVDEHGKTQPLETPWNAQGYLWNAVDRVGIQVLEAGTSGL
jgi:sulfite oxidase